MLKLLWYTTHDVMVTNISSDLNTIVITLDRRIVMQRS